MTTSMTIQCACHITRHGHGARKEMKAGQQQTQVSTEPGRVPRISRLMALALRLDKLLRSGELRSCAQIAELGHVTRARVSQILGGSLPGRNGGYILAVPPERITMGQVVRFFDGVLSPIGCVSMSEFQPCNQAPTCRFRRVFLEVRNLTAEHMDNATLARVAQHAPVADREVFVHSFTDGDGI